MLGEIWAFIKMILAWWNALLVAIGLIKKAVHEHELDKIDDITKRAGDEKAPLEDRLKAGQELEDEFNRNT